MSARVTRDGIQRALETKWWDENLSDFEKTVRLEHMSSVTSEIFAGNSSSAWCHQPLQVALLGRRSIPSIANLGDSIDQYLDTEFLHCQSLDWLLANAIMFSEINAAAHQIGLARYHDRGSTPKSRTVWKGLKTSGPV